jgi:hypothetical protein
MPWRVVQLPIDPNGTGAVTRLYPSKIETEGFRARELGDVAGDRFGIVETDENGRLLPLQGLTEPDAE